MMVARLDAAEDSGSNRTFMELKLYVSDDIMSDFMRSNRTFMELKCSIYVIGVSIIS